MKILNYAKFGPVSRYSEAHVYLVLDMLVSNGVSSRAAISDELGVGEGSARSLIEIMRRWRMVSVSRAGVEATEDGKRVYRDIPLRLIDFGELPGKGYLFGVAVQGIADRFTDGNAQRDLAIRHGAEEACVFALREGNTLRMDAASRWLDAEDAEKAVAGLKEGDLLVLLLGKDIRSAKASAASVGIELV